MVLGSVNHLSLTVTDRDRSEPFYAAAPYTLLLEIGATILDPPVEYNQYAPGYDAVFFADPRWHQVGPGSHANYPRIDRTKPMGNGRSSH